MRFLLPQTPLPLPVHQCGSTASQQPPLPSPLICPTDHLSPDLSVQVLSSSTTHTTTAILSSDSSTNSKAHVPCSALTSWPCWSLPLSASSLNTPLSGCLKPLKLWWDLQFSGSPQAPAPEQYPKRAGSMVGFSMQPYSSQQNIFWRRVIQQSMREEISNIRLHSISWVPQ